MKYSTPSKQGVNPRAIMSFIDEIEHENIEMHSLVIIKNGYIVAEGYWKPYTADRLHELYSATKVFISMAIGFAIDEGLLSLDDTLLKDKLGGLTLEKEPIIVRRSETERDITSKAYYFEENEMSMVPLGEKWVINDDAKNIQYMQFDFCDKYMLLRWQEAGKFSCIKIGMDGNDIEDTYRTDCCDKVVLSRAHWEDDKTLVIIMRSIEIVTTYTLRCTFEDNTVRVTMHESMPICNDEYVPLIGKQG